MKTALVISQAKTNKKVLKINMKIFLISKITIEINIMITGIIKDLTPAVKMTLKKISKKLNLRKVNKM